MDWVDILCTILTGVFTLCGVILTTSRTNAQLNTKLDKNLAVTDTKLENLTREVRECTTLAVKIPVIVDRCDRLEKDVHDLENRIIKIESK